SWPESCSSLARQSKGFRLLAVEPVLGRPERLTGLIPIDLCGQFLHLSAGQDFADQLQVLQGNDRREVLTIAADDYGLVLRSHLRENLRILPGRLRFIHAAWFLD